MGTSAQKKIKPEEFILAALSPEERLEAAFSVARAAFRKTGLKVGDIEQTVKTHRKHSDAPQT
jgi:hypothetical protein